MSELKIHAGECVNGQAYCGSLGGCIVISMVSFVRRKNDERLRDELCGNCIRMTESRWRASLLGNPLPYESVR